MSRQQRVLSQRFWPAAGDVDDCWVLATLMAIAAVAPWKWLVSVKDFRVAANKPDDPKKPSPGGVNDAAVGMRKLYPDLPVIVGTKWTWADVLTRLKAGHPAYVSVGAGGLPARLQFGLTKGDHAVAVQQHNGELFMGNPLAPPHASWKKITAEELRKAAFGHSQAGDGLAALFVPTEAQAFTTHPLAKGLGGASETQLAAARRSGFDLAKQKGTAAIGALEL